jgi:type II secretory pathway pseudopilin PulG
MLQPAATVSRRRRNAVRRDDAGATLMEMIVALMIFAVIASALLTLLLSTARMSGDTKSRSVAASIAASVIDEARALGPTEVPAGGTHLTRTVGGRAYTVVRDAIFVKRGEATSCSSSGVLSYLRVNVTVSWDQLGSTKSVASDTLLTPRTGDLDATKGSVAVEVLDRTGAGVADVPVTLAPAGTAGVPSVQRTTRDGCAMFAFVAPGQYTASLAKDGYTDQTASSAPKTSTTVSAGTIAPVKFIFDQGATLRVSLVGEDPARYPAPDDLRLTLYSPAVFGTSTNTRVFGVTSPPRRISSLTSPTVPLSLFPDNAGYGGWAGECLANTPPATSQVVQAVTEPGKEGELVVGVAPFEVQRDRGGAVGTAGWTVVATQAKDTAGGCTTGASYTFVSKDPNVVGGSLPSGQWTFEIVDGTRSVSTPAPVALVLGATTATTVTLALP